MHKPLGGTSSDAWGGSGERRRQGEGLVVEGAKHFNIRVTSHQSRQSSSTKDNRLTVNPGRTGRSLVHIEKNPAGKLHTSGPSAIEEGGDSKRPIYDVKEAWL